jgi:hypothetical protein
VIPKRAQIGSNLIILELSDVHLLCVALQGLTHHWHLRTFLHSLHLRNGPTRELRCFDANLQCIMTKTYIHVDKKISTCAHKVCDFYRAQCWSFKCQKTEQTACSSTCAGCSWSSGVAQKGCGWSAKWSTLEFRGWSCEQIKKGIIAGSRGAGYKVSIKLFWTYSENGQNSSFGFLVGAFYSQCISNWGLQDALGTHMSPCKITGGKNGIQYLHRLRFWGFRFTWFWVSSEDQHWTNLAATW